MHAIKRFLRDYYLETIIVIASISLTAGMFILFVKGGMAKEFIPIANAGFLFVAAQIYGRLKDRRDAKRKRAQDLFLEWHSKEIRESRIYLSRWHLVNKETAGNIPSLGRLEKAAAEVYLAKYRALSVKSTDTNTEKHELDKPELQEFHAFKLYQFFERWALLVKNNDIDYRSANDYMGTYKDWWMNNFIIPWMNNENDEYIRGSLSVIIKYLRPKTMITKRWIRKLRAGSQNERSVATGLEE